MAIFALVAECVSIRREYMYMTWREEIWAQEAGLPVVPTVAAEDKGKITELFADIDNPIDIDPTPKL